MIISIIIPMMIMLFVTLIVMVMKVDWLIVIYGSVIHIMTTALVVQSLLLAVSSNYY